MVTRLPVLRMVVGVVVRKKYMVRAGCSLPGVKNPAERETDSSFEDFKFSILLHCNQLQQRIPHSKTSLVVSLISRGLSLYCLENAALSRFIGNSFYIMEH